MAREKGNDFQDKMFDSVTGGNGGTEGIEMVKTPAETTGASSLQQSDSLKEALLEDNKESFEDKYKRKTFPLEIELHQRLEAHFKGKGRGYQTKFAKYAITKALDELEGK